MKTKQMFNISKGLDRHLSKTATKKNAELEISVLSSDPIPITEDFC